MIDLADGLTRNLNVGAAVCMRFASPERTYSAVLQQDLLGDWTVTQSWGGKFNRRGGGQIRLVDDFPAGLSMLQAIAKQRHRHGYHLIPA
jgi:hypothetical protein